MVTNAKDLINGSNNKTTPVANGDTQDSNKLIDSIVTREERIRQILDRINHDLVSVYNSDSVVIVMYLRHYKNKPNLDNGELCKFTLPSGKIIMTIKKILKPMKKENIHSFFNIKENQDLLNNDFLYLEVFILHSSFTRAELLKNSGFVEDSDIQIISTTNSISKIESINLFFTDDYESKIKKE